MESIRPSLRPVIENKKIRRGKITDRKENQRFNEEIIRKSIRKRKNV